MLDPGPDFAKTPAQTVAVLRGLDRVRALGRPVLLAVSRKDFIGAVTGRAPRERDAGTLAALAHGSRGRRGHRARARRRGGRGLPGRARRARRRPRAGARGGAHARPLPGRSAVPGRVAGACSLAWMPWLPAAAHNAAGRRPTDPSGRRDHMSSVLDRDALAESPLADLHLLANELGVDGFRRLRRDDLIDAIIARQAGQEPAGRGAGRRGAAGRAPASPRLRRGRGRARAQAAARAPRRPRRTKRGEGDADAEDARAERRPPRPRTASSRASSSCSPTARRSSACRRPSRPTTTSTSRPPRSSAASSFPATACAARCARRAAPSASRRWSASTRSTGARPTRSPRARASRSCRSSGRPSASSSAPRT